MRISTLVLSLLLSATAFAAPFTTRGGEPVRVRVGTRSQVGIGLRPSRADGSWRLVVRGAQAPHAEVIDVTNGATRDKWVVELVASGSAAELVFDSSRFVAGHAYRVVLHGGEEAIVYLYAPPRGHGSSRVVFGDERAESVTEDGIAITPKSAL